MTSFSCPQCAAVVEMPDERLADRCAFCESALVRVQGSAIPYDAIAPFEIPQPIALTRLQHYLQAQWLAPGAVRRLADPEALVGVLIPFYAYSGLAHSRYRARIGLYWYRTETYTVTVNGKRQTRTRTVRETEWFSTRGKHVRCYNDQLASGSRGLPEAESNALEPFDLGKLLPFVPERVAGWIAEHPSIDHAEARRVVQQELEAQETREITAFLPGDEVQVDLDETRVQVDNVRLVLLPVWVASFQHQHHVFRLLVNGQTGEVVGKVPHSTAKIILLALLILAVVAAVFYAGSASGGSNR